MSQGCNIAEGFLKNQVELHQVNQGIDQVTQDESSK
jgi:hypothetical protein